MSRAAALALAAMVLLASVVLVQFARPWIMPRTPLPVIESLGGEFSLPSTLGHDTALAEFRGRLVLVNFGFTSCPDVCPTVLARMRAALLGLGRDAARVQALFVTIDPARDSLELLGPYVRHFHPSIIAMRGTEQQTERVAALFKVYSERQVLPPPLDYGFAHSDQIYLLDRAGRVRATFASNTSTEVMVDVINRLLDE
jgi:protein SCO1/2